MATVCSRILALRWARRHRLAPKDRLYRGLDALRPHEATIERHLRDVILPPSTGRAHCLRCGTHPDKRQRILLARLALRLPRRVGHPRWGDVGAQPGVDTRRGSDPGPSESPPHRPSPTAKGQPRTGKRGNSFDREGGSDWRRPPVCAWQQAGLSVPRPGEPQVHGREPVTPSISRYQQWIEPLAAARLVGGGKEGGGVGRRCSTDERFPPM